MTVAGLKDGALRSYNSSVEPTPNPSKGAPKSIASSKQLERWHPLLRRGGAQWRHAHKRTQEAPGWVRHQNLSSPQQSSIINPLLQQRSCGLPLFQILKRFRRHKKK